MFYYYLLVSFPTLLLIAGIVWGIKVYQKIPKDSIVSLTAYAVLIISSIFLAFVFLFAIIKSEDIESFIIFVLIAVMLSFINKAIKLLIKKIKEKKILESMTIIAVSSVVILSVTPMMYSRVIMYGETINFVRCKIYDGDWIEVRGSFNGSYECGFEKTIDGGQSCRKSSDCTLNCVLDNPFSDLNGPGSICQTHKRFLDGKTVRTPVEKKPNSIR